MTYRIWSAVVAFVFSISVSLGQQSSQVDPPQPRESKRILGIIPNYRTSPSLQNYAPLTDRDKFKVASQDALDPGTAALAAAFGGQGQLSNGNRPFGQGAAGFGRYFGAAYGTS